MDPKSKCVYIAPLKSLARERLKEWRSKFSSLKWSVLELSGDTSYDSNSIQRADILVCTPEKWDLITRGWRDPHKKQFVSQVKLLIMDEIHLLGEERGAVLEAIVSRTRFISKQVTSESESEDEMTRILGLSTALANPTDLADWMGINTEAYDATKNRGLYNFRPSVRPIPMEVHIQGYPGRHYCPRMASMNKPCYAAIKDHSPRQPVIIFVASRRQTRLTAIDLISYAAGEDNPGCFLGCDDAYIESVARTVNDENLRHTLTFGVGLHHAGIGSKDRELVETLFLNGDIQVLVATGMISFSVKFMCLYIHSSADMYSFPLHSHTCLGCESPCTPCDSEGKYSDHRNIFYPLDATLTMNSCDTTGHRILRWENITLCRLSSYRCSSNDG